MVLKVTRLPFHSTTYSRKNKYKGRHLIKEGSSGYKEQKQRCPSTQRRVMDKKNYSRSDNVEEELDNGG